MRAFCTQPRARTSRARRAAHDRALLLCWTQWVMVRVVARLPMDRAAPRNLDMELWTTVPGYISLPGRLMSYDISRPGSLLLPCFAKAAAGSMILSGLAVT